MKLHASTQHHLASAIALGVSSCRPVRGLLGKQSLLRLLTTELDNEGSA